MIDFPKTRKEARQYLYGRWAGNPKGTKWREGHCAYEISISFGYFCQCSRKMGYGVEGLYCKQHAKIIEAKNNDTTN